MPGFASPAITPSNAVRCASFKTAAIARSDSARITWADFASALVSRSARSSGQFGDLGLLLGREVQSLGDVRFGGGLHPQAAHANPFEPGSLLGTQDRQGLDLRVVAEGVKLLRPLLGRSVAERRRQFHRRVLALLDQPEERLPLRFGQVDPRADLVFDGQGQDAQEIIALGQRRRHPTSGDHQGRGQQAKTMAKHGHSKSNLGLYALGRRPPLLSNPILATRDRCFQKNS